jgi:regulation of enolase protein 1 (concanavalin A-like superfamily)
MKSKSLLVALVGVIACIAIGAKAPAANDDAPKAIFHDRFSGKLEPGWEWVHEDAKGWRITDDGLQIRALPGTLWLGANNAHNLLVRALPEGVRDFTIEVTVTNAPAAGGEQAGLVLYHDDDNYIKLVKESLEGKQWVVMGREQGGKGEMVKRTEVKAKPTKLRIARANNIVTTSIQGEDGTWNELGHCAAVTNTKSPLKIGVLSHGGPGDAERWASFKDLRVLSPP